MDSVDRHRYTNSRNTFLALLDYKVIPIVNENDVVSIDELKIGDNDNLSALVAGIVDADLLIILSDVDGLYTANPQKDPNAKLVPEVTDITQEIEESAGDAGSNVGTGGMFTKIQAAKVATSSGIHMVIASGEEKDAISRITEGEEVGTLFVSSVVDTSGHELARGLTNYSSEELTRIKGAKTSEIEALIGHKHFDEVIHRDDLVIL